MSRYERYLNDTGIYKIHIIRKIVYRPALVTYYISKVTVSLFTSLSKASRRISSARTSLASSFRTSLLSTGLRSMSEYSRPDSFRNTETNARGSRPASPPAPVQSQTISTHPAVHKHVHPPSGRRTLYAVGLPRVGHAVRVEEPVFSTQNISYHLSYGVIVDLLLRAPLSKNLRNVKLVSNNYFISILTWWMLGGGGGGARVLLLFFYV